MLRSWLAGKLVTWIFDGNNRGDPSRTLLMEADDVRFRFPGSSSWGGERVGKAAVAEWLHRMCATGLQHRLERVVASGPPWAMTMVIRATDHLDDPDDGRVYENRYVIWALTRWGKLVDYEVYEDTEKAVALDAWMTSKGRGPATTAG